MKYEYEYSFSKLIQGILYVHIADKNGAVVDIPSKYPFGHSHSQLQLQIYLEKIVLTKQTDVLLSRRACVEPTAVARFFTTEYKISGRVVTVALKPCLKS